MTAFRRALFAAAAVSALTFAAPAQSAAAPLLYPLFQDHMVIQRDKPIIVWGTAQPGATVNVVLTEDKTAGTGPTTIQAYANVAVADQTGVWRTTLPKALPAGGPYKLIAQSGGQSQIVKDVLIGDVYLCSGQSNMEMPVHVASNYDTDLNGASNAQIRLFHVQHAAAAAPVEGFAAGTAWAVTSPDAVRDFSASCYYFGRELQPTIKVPLGLIESAWGGSTIQPWLSAPVLDGLGFRKELDILDQYARDPQAAEKQWWAAADDWWRAHDPGSAATPPWRDPAYDDSSWEQIVPAGYWEGWGIAELSNFDGIVWFRKTVTLTAAQAKGEAVLSLGPVDDIDTTWVNGTQIGQTEVWDAPRVYKVPAGVLHEGKNLIAFGDLDGGAGGGPWGATADKRLTFADGSTMVLDTPWRWRIAADVRQTGVPDLAPWTPNHGLAMLYNGMIAPLGPIAVKGIVWYQGESNVGDPGSYGKFLKALIASWRQRFGEDAAFLNVQLPNCGAPVAAPDDSYWARLREQQRLVANKTPNGGLAVTIDIGQRDNVHPTDKQNVGKRLALIARKVVYGQDVVADGPRPVSAARQSRSVRIVFDQNLTVYESNRPLGFQLCDKADKCRFADARADGNAVVLDAAAVPAAAKVRFCWADSPICNVYNAAGLPAIPFEIAIASAKSARK
jgi:sialate O-acetylesterase